MLCILYTVIILKIAETIFFSFGCNNCLREEHVDFKEGVGSSFTLKLLLTLNLHGSQLLFPEGNWGYCKTFWDNSQAEEELQTCLAMSIGYYISVTVSVSVPIRGNDHCWCNSIMAKHCLTTDQEPSGVGCSCTWIWGRDVLPGYHFLPIESNKQPTLKCSAIPLIHMKTEIIWKAAMTVLLSLNAEE